MQCHYRVVQTGTFMNAYFVRYKQLMPRNFKNIIIIIACFTIINLHNKYFNSILMKECLTRFTKISTTWIIISNTKEHCDVTNCRYIDISIYRSHFQLPIYRIRYIDAACGGDISFVFFFSISRIFELPIYRYLKSIAD